MRSLEVELPNGSDGDSLLLARLRPEGRTLIFDCGETHRIDARDLLRVDHVLVSHCHVDHFVGFDSIVRPRVCRTEHATAHGPPGFLARVQARLDGYTWNLTAGNNFVLTAREVHADVVLSARFDSGRSFAREDLPPEARRDATCWSGEAFTIESAALDHHVVSMGWAIQRPLRVSVRAEALAAAGLAPGPWLAELKRAVAAGRTGEPFAVPGRPARRLADVAADLLDVSPGERLAFVTDTACTDATRPLIASLARNADVFACGAPFLDRESDRAAETRHLTARQAGEIAAEAGARRLLLFHVSDRYAGDAAAHVAEAAEAAGGGVEVETRAAPTAGG